ncbi:MAG: hypothetical protein KH330_13145 [Clostridiales bacterium]|nr:hypothetical protein [Clostridiales bacterium]
MEQLKQEEAKRLLEMLKYTLTNEINFPEKGMAKEFTVKSTTTRDMFTIRIYRGKSIIENMN